MSYFTFRGWNSSLILVFVCLLAEVNNVHAPSWSYGIYLLFPGEPYTLRNPKQRPSNPCLTRTVAVNLQVVIIQLFGVVRVYSRPMSLNFVAI